MGMKLPKADVLRKNELAKIHLAKKQLALDDDEYRAILLSVTGRQSAADLDWQGRNKYPTVAAVAGNDAIESRPCRKSMNCAKSVLPMYILSP